MVGISSATTCLLIVFLYWESATSKPASSASASSPSSLHRLSRERIVDSIQRRKKQVKDGLMEKLGFTRETMPTVNASEVELPNVGKVREIVNTLKEEERMMGDAAFDAHRRPSVVEKIYVIGLNPKTTTIPSHRSGIHRHPKIQKMNTFDFVISGHADQVTIRKAYLSVYVGISPANRQNRKLVVELFECNGTHTRRKRWLMGKTVERSAEESRTDWVKVDISTVIRDWVAVYEKSGNGNHTLGVVVRTKKKNIAHFESTNKPAFLELITDLAPLQGRAKRSVGEDCENGCCRRSMKIHFEEMGYNFIFAPASYDAGVCVGQCHRDDSSTHHAAVTNRACCHPIEYRNLTVALTNQHKDLIITEIPGMVATRCGCS